MINVKSIHADVVQDSVNKFENGNLSIPMFSRLSRIGELWLIDWLTGDTAAQQPPAPYLSQKNKDWLAPLIKKFPVNIVNGSFTRPADYYQYENMYRIAAPTSDCEDENPDYAEVPNANITLLDGAKFNERSTTYISELKPSMGKAIAKQVGKDFEFFPKDLGPVVLEYIRYPVFAELKSKMDTVYNEEVPDDATSINYEWDENARPLLVWKITDLFFNHTREQAGKQFNAASGKTVRG